MLELAEVIGEDVDTTTLLAASDWTHDTTLEALDAAVEAGLLDSGADGSFRFPHALAGQAVLRLLPLSRRAREHARVAQVIETRLPESDRHVWQLAYHYAGAHTLGFADKAARYLTEAAGVADRSLAHEDAARLLERAASSTMTSAGSPARCAAGWPAATGLHTGSRSCACLATGRSTASARLPRR